MTTLHFNLSNISCFIFIVFFARRIRITITDLNLYWNVWNFDSIMKILFLFYFVSIIRSNSFRLLCDPVDIVDIQVTMPLFHLFPFQSRMSMGISFNQSYSPVVKLFTLSLIVLWILVSGYFPFRFSKGLMSLSSNVYSQCK